MSFVNGKWRNGGSILDPLVLNQRLQLIREMKSGERLHRRSQFPQVANAATLRSLSLRGRLDPRRDYETEAGCPKIDEVVPLEIYQQLYERNPIAERVVNFLPDQCWSVCPSVYEDEDTGNVTKFEYRWDGIGRMLAGEKSWHVDEEGSLVWDYLYCLDEQAGIGAYAVMLIGINDGLDLAEPPQMKKDQEITFLRVFPEQWAQVHKLDEDQRSPRYGQPTEYTITLTDVRSTGSQGQQIGKTQQVTVHWQRVIHVARNAHNSPFLGVSEMRPVLNNLYGLHKLYLSNPEGYYQSALPMWVFSTDPRLGGEHDVDLSSAEDQAEEMFNSMQRFLFQEGLIAQSLSPGIQSPKEEIECQLDAICICKDYPKRIFMGSERGELASSQDARKHATRIRSRQIRFCTPRVIVPFVNRLISLGVLPEPKEFHVHWPELYSQTLEEKASIAEKATRALGQWISTGGDAVIPPMDFLTRLLWFTEEEAEAILENALDQIKADSFLEKEQDDPNPEPVTTEEN